MAWNQSSVNNNRVKCGIGAHCKEVSKLFCLCVLHFSQDECETCPTEIILSTLHMLITYYAADLVKGE